MEEIVREIKQQEGQMDIGKETGKIVVMKT